MGSLIDKALDEFLKEAVTMFEAQLKHEGKLKQENIRLRVQWIKRFVEFLFDRYEEGKHVE